MSKALNFKEMDYSQPIRQKEVQDLGFLRVGGLYRSKQSNFFAVPITIIEATYLTWAPGDRPKEIVRYSVDYLVGEKIWNWIGRSDQLDAWEYCYEKLR